jgi:hypothetical protein
VPAAERKSGTSLVVDAAIVPTMGFFSECIFLHIVKEFSKRRSSRQNMLNTSAGSLEPHKNYYVQALHQTVHGVLRDQCERIVHGKIPTKAMLILNDPH